MQKMVVLDQPAAHHARCSGAVCGSRAVGHSKAAKAASRDRILDQAARDVRRHGPEALAIAPLMASAGLTHGAFYSHFADKAELTVAAVEQALDEGEARFHSEGDGTDLDNLVRRYLSRAHRDNVEGGCGVAAMICEVLEEPRLRALVAARVQSYQEQIERVANSPSDSWATLATMIGALLLARVTDETNSRAILKAAKNAILR
jgi:TetR/AcrR family transcriptional repressor of nem operon